VSRKELSELGMKLWCAHDFGHFAGWNPDMKFERIKFMLDGDDCCEFVCGVEG